MYKPLQNIIFLYIDQITLSNTHLKKKIDTSSDGHEIAERF
jgi:hypothetical protein